MGSPVVDETRYGPCDVLVAGGGMAGIAAAIAAARNGANTLLVEKAGWLGGLGVTGPTGLHTFFNIFDTHPGAEPMRVVAGIAEELVERVWQLGGGNWATSDSDFILSDYGEGEAIGAELEKKQIMLDAFLEADPWRRRR